METLIETPNRQPYYQGLLACGDASINSFWLSQIIASWQAGMGVLPDYMGLTPAQFNRLRAFGFPGYGLECHAISGSDLNFERMLEKHDLEKLLRLFAVTQSEEIEWIIAMLVAACLGNDHLWQDLGLWSRKELSALFQHNFPALFALNNKDMKWKKFLYKQLCEAEGIYVCRAPSCEVCQDYLLCFGKEE